MVDSKDPRAYSKPAVNPPEVTPEMVREAEGHLPFKIGSLTERWQWLAAFLTNALRNPGVPCPCCGVAPNGELFDHMPPMEWRVLQPRGELLNDVAAVRKVLASDQAPTLHAVATALNPESMRRLTRPALTAYILSICQALGYEWARTRINGEFTRVLRPASADADDRREAGSA